MSDDKAKVQIDRPERTVEARALKAPDVHSARLSGRDEMRRVEQARTNASDGSLRKLPADWQEQNESIQLTDGEVSISRTNPLKEADLGRGTGRNTNGKPYSVFSAEASQAVERPRPIARALTDSQYQSSVKLNVQITNVPEVSKGVIPEDLLAYAGTVMDTGARAVRPIEEHLSKPNAVNEGLWHLPASAAKVAGHFAQSAEQLNKDVAVVIGSVLDAIDKPMTARQRAQSAGMLMPMFCFEESSEVIDAETVKHMKLDRMTESELKMLGIGRTEMYMAEVPEELKRLELTKAGSSLLTAIESKGREIAILEEGSEAANRLKNMGKQASVFTFLEGPDYISLGKDPSKIAALEEFLHGTQRRIPSLAREERVILEIEVKDFMIRHQKLLALSENDVAVLKALRQQEIENAYRQGLRWIP